MLQAADGESLLLGVVDGVPLGYAGAASLLTIAPPGAGKSQGQVIPNLLHYPGPMIVLDLKGELSAATAGYRQACGAHILMFSLMGDGAPAHRFNPLACLNDAPALIWEEARAFAETLIPLEPQSRNSFWVNQARDVIAVIIGDLLLSEERPHRTMAAVMQLLGKGGAARSTYLMEVADRAQAQGQLGLANRATGLGDLERAEQTLEGIYAQARQALSCFESYTVQQALSGHDWTPDALRTPKTTLYLRAPFEKLAFYAPVLRAVLGAHLTALQRSLPPRDALPVTLLLDELPQLGNFEEVVKAVELGRQYGVRVWAFAQHAQQLETSFARADVLLHGMAVTMAIRPDLALAQRLSATIGEQRNPLTGQTRPLATPAELMSPKYANKVIVIAPGNYPMQADLPMAWRDDPWADRLGWACSVDVR